MAEQADESAERLVDDLGDRAVEVAALVREMAADREHPFHETIRKDTMYNWVADPESWAKFQVLAQQMSDRITK